MNPFKHKLVTIGYRCDSHWVLVLQPKCLELRASLSITLTTTKFCRIATTQISPLGHVRRKTPVQPSGRHKIPRPITTEQTMPSLLHIHTASLFLRLMITRQTLLYTNPLFLWLVTTGQTSPSFPLQIQIPGVHMSTVILRALGTGRNPISPPFGVPQFHL